MKRCRLKRYNFKIKNKMEKINKINKMNKNENGNDFTADVVKPFYCQKPIDYKPSLKCDTQCGLCAMFEGKWD